MSRTEDHTPALGKRARESTFDCVRCDQAVDASWAVHRKVGAVWLPYHVGCAIEATADALRELRHG
jgi:hypothetical protein